MSVAAQTAEPLGDHQLLRRIGSGSYGEVWLARAVTGAYRAIKIVRRDSFEHDRPFEREFSGILRFEPVSRKHESQMDVLHVGRGDGYFYYVMELADDQLSGQQINPDTYAPRTLKSDLYQRGAIPFEECVQISLALTTALEHLHKNGLAHRDVKPSNVIFVNGVPKLADIGLVTPVDATRSFVGTEGFAPPEGPGSPQADIYSLGKVLYEMATGKDRQDFPELPTNVAALPESEALIELNAVIAKACRQQPSERYKSAEEMHRDLLLLQSGKSLAKLRVVERRLRALKRWSFALLSFALLISAAFVYEARQSRIVSRLAAEKQRMLDEKAKLAYAADVALAQVSLKENNLGRTIEILNRQRPEPGEPDRRGWEWRYLWGQCQSDSLRVFHQGAWFKSVSCSADGKWLAGGEFEGRVKVWDFPAGTLVSEIDRANNCTFSPTEPLLAYVASTSTNSFSGKEVVLWNVQTQRIEAKIPHSGIVRGIAFASNGQSLLTFSESPFAESAEITLWNRSDRTIRKTIKVPWKASHAKPVNNLRMADDGTFAVYSAREKIYAVDLLTGEVRWSAVAAEEFLLSVALSSDDSILATGAGWAESDIRLWDVRSGQEIGRLKGHTGFVGSLLFADNDSEVISGSGDQTIRVWDLATRQSKRVLRGHRLEIWAIASTSDPGVIASGGKDGMLSLWSLKEETKPRSEIRLPGSYYYWQFTPDGQRIITVDHQRNVTQWDGANFLESTSLGKPPEDERYPVLHPDGTKLLMGTGDGRVRARSLEHLRLIHEFQAGAGRTLAFQFVPLKKIAWIATSDPPMFRAFNFETWEPTGQSVALEGASDFSRDGRKFGSVSASRIKMIDLESGSKLERDFDLSEVSDASFSPDGALFAVSSTRAFVRIFDTATLREHYTFTSFLLGVTSINFSPDGRSILAGNPGGGYAIKFFDLASSQEILSLPGEGSGFHWTAFSNDGRMLGTMNDKGTVHLWRAPSWDEIEGSQREAR